MQACGEVLLVIRFSKQFWLNPAKIWVSGIRCSFNNIVKISSVFDLKWIVVTIDSVTEGSSLLTFVKDQGLKYFARPCSIGYVEMSAVVPYPLFEDFLDKAIKEDPENIFVLNLLDPANGSACMQHSYEEAVIAGSADVFISIALDENALLICVNKSLIIPQKVFKRLKELCFD